MLKFECTENQLVELSIVGYQFDDEERLDEYDYNWLYIKLNADLNNKSYTVTYPALLTWELRNLSKWFKDLSINKVKKVELEFLEPCISFELLSSKTEKIKQIRINLALEFSQSTSDDGLSVIFEADSQTLKNYSIQIKEDLEEFPER